MGKYNVFIKSSAVRNLEKIPKKIAQQIVKRINSLAQDPRPHGNEKLSGEEKYRVRQGDYRIVYGIDDDRQIVEVVKIGHRREVYR